MTEVLMSGTFGQDAATELRGLLAGHKVVLKAGFGGERVLTALGSFTEQQWKMLRGFILRLVGAREIEEITIDGDKITLRGVSEEKLPEVVESVEVLLDRVKPQG